MAFKDRFRNLREQLSEVNPFTPPLQLPRTEQSSQGLLSGEDTYTDNYTEPSWFTLSRWDRILVFAICFAGSISCYLITFFLFPVLALKPRKFAILWSLGSILFLVSFAAMQGPVAFAHHLVTGKRIMFTISFLSSIILTLVFALVVKSTILSIFAAIIQLVAAIWYTVSYFPMGTESLRFASSIASNQVNSWIQS